MDWPGDWGRQSIFRLRDIDVDLFDHTSDDAIDCLVELFVVLRHQNDILLLALHLTLVFLLEPHCVALWLGRLLIFFEFTCITIFLLFKQRVEGHGHLLIGLPLSHDVTESLLGENEQPFKEFLVRDVVERLRVHFKHSEGVNRALFKYSIRAIREVADRNDENAEDDGRLVATGGTRVGMTHWL